MSRASKCVLLFCACAFFLSGQSLPWYLHGYYPNASATGVPTNTSILLQIEQIYSQYGQIYTLKNQSGTAIQLSTNGYYTDLTLTPVALLAPFTRYTFAITPDPTVGSAYSFSFTTGSGPDTTPPHLVSISPKTGTSGIGVEGPFFATFDKVLDRAAAANMVYGGGVSLHASGGLIVQPAITVSGDSMGIQIRIPTPAWAAALQLTVDPSKFKDAFGNMGQGPPQVAQYTTFIATDTGGPILKGYFPANGDNGLPVNVSIRLLFDRNVDPSSAAAGISLTSNGKAVPVTYAPFANGQGIALKPSGFLAPNQTFQVSVGSALLDQQGFPLQQSLSFQFSTAADPDATPAQLVTYGPPQGVLAPLNTLAAMRVNKRIMPLFSFALTTSNNAGGLPATGAISPDGRTFTVQPAVPLTPFQTYQLGLTDVVDLTGTSFASGFSFTPSGDVDNAPPSALAVMPADGSQGVPTSVPIQVLFSEPLGVPQIDNSIRLSAAGQTVPAAITFDGAGLATVAPSKTLDPNTTYTLELNAVPDFAGNVMPASSTQFTTGSTPAPATPVHLLSSTPAQNDNGVDVNASIALTFDSPLSSLSAFRGFIVSDSTGNYPVTATVSGPTLTIQPSHALLQNSTITVQASVTDTNGRYGQIVVSFRTAANGDTTPLQVISVSPPDGSAIAGRSRNITLTFNKAVNAATLPVLGGIVAFSNGTPVKITTMRANNDLSVIVTPAIDSGDVTLVADAGVTDFGGNPLIPFRAQYTFSSANAGNYSNSVLEVRPASGSTGVPATSSITWFFSNAVDFATVQSSLVVVADGVPVAGSFALSKDGTILMFQPGAPFSAGASIRYYQRSPLFSDSYGFTFTVAAAAAPPLRLVRYTPAPTAPANSILEFEFSAPVFANQNLVSLHQSLPNSTLGGALIPTVTTSPSPNVLRLNPITPLTAGNYVIVISPDSQNLSQSSISYHATAPVVTPSDSPVAAPVAGSVGVPVNASIRIGFETPLNPLTVISGCVQLQFNGLSPTVLLYLSQDSRGLVATPTQALPPNTSVQVSLTGLEDVYGKPIPARTWNFTTAAGADFQPAQLIESSLPNVGTATIPANGAIAFVFNKPLDPSVTPFTLSPQVALTTHFSDDLQTITVSANPKFAKGLQYQIYPQRIIDIDGIPVNNVYSTSFNVAFDPDVTPPRLVQLSPGDSQTGLPLNAQIIAAFDKPMSEAPLGTVQLLRGSDQVPLIPQTAELRRLRLAPAQPLDPNTTYTIVISGAADLSGNAMAGTVTRTFTTGDRVDTILPSAQVLATGAPNVPIRILFSKPVSPATVDSQSIVLNIASTQNTSSWSWVPIPAVVALSADGLMVTLTPANPLNPGWRYEISSSGIRDFVGNLAGGLSAPTPTFIAASAPDNTPPVMTIVPTDGSTAIPYFTKLRAYANKAILPPPLSTVTFQVTTGGQPVSGTFVQSGSFFNFTPDVPLATGTTYRIDIGNVTDLAGNVAPTASSTFTTSATQSAAPQQLQIVSSMPANGDSGVAVNTPLAITFNLPIDPASISFNSIQVQTSFPTSVSSSVSGNTVTITPSESWPSASAVTIYFGNSPYNGYLQDVVGNRMPVYLNQPIAFKTVAIADPNPPQLLSATPAAGTPVAAPTASFQLTFSKTVAVGSGGLTTFSGSQASSVNAGYDSGDLHTLILSPNFNANSVLTIVGTDAIVDRAGNSVAPFALQYPTVAAAIAGPPSVSLVTPNYSTNVAPTTPIIVRFNRSMDPQSLLQSVRVTQDGENITGKLTASDSNQTVQFTPDNPYGAGSQIDIFVLETTIDASGAALGSRFHSSFTVTSQPTMSVYEVSFGKEVSPDAALEIGFNQKLDPLTAIADNVWLRSEHRTIAGTVSLRGDRIVRFVPSAPLKENVDYVLTVGSGLRAANLTKVVPEEFLVHASAAVPVAAVDSMGADSVNGRSALHIHFSQPINPLSVDQSHVLDFAGADVAVDLRLGSDFRDVWLIPRRSVADVRSLTFDSSEMEDRAGHRLTPFKRRVGAEGK